MILNTATTGYGSQNLPALQSSIDKYYLYSHKYQTANSHYFCIPNTNYNNQISESGLEDLMNQRRDIIHAKVQMELSDIYQRHRIKEDSLYQICLDQCSCRNLIYLMGEDMYMDKRRFRVWRCAD